jgi:hypothetical protein
MKKESANVAGVLVGWPNQLAADQLYKLDTWLSLSFILLSSHSYSTLLPLLIHTSTHSLAQ